MRKGDGKCKKKCRGREAGKKGMIEMKEERGDRKEKRMEEN